jgi:hypothetical protein
MSTLQHLLDVTIPVSPPCFSTRTSWVEFVASAAEAQRADKRGPILLERGQPARFDLAFDYCQDCLASHRRAMVIANRCDPLALHPSSMPPRIAYA